MKTLTELGKACKQASHQIMNADRKQKDALLNTIAKQLEQDIPAILEANAQDIKNARENGMAEGLIDRMLLNEARMRQIIEGIHQVHYRIPSVKSRICIPQKTDCRSVRCVLHWASSA